jgi:hypothetical protein
MTAKRVAITNNIKIGMYSISIMIPFFLPLTSPHSPTFPQAGTIVPENPGTRKAIRVKTCKTFLKKGVDRIANQCYTIFSPGATQVVARSLQNAMVRRDLQSRTWPGTKQGLSIRGQGGSYFAASGRIMAVESLENLPCDVLAHPIPEGGFYR